MVWALVVQEASMGPLVSLAFHPSADGVLLSSINIPPFDVKLHL